MALQNRADPFGTLHAVSHRGMFTGNRGVIHDPETKRLTGRRWTTKSWIVCVCAWKGRRRDPMGRNGRGGGAGWTELFFLDEVTALAAGHRPCFYCRRAAAVEFAKAFAAGNGLEPVSAPDIDAVLHGQRRLSAPLPPVAITQRDLAQLPDGAMIECKNQAFAIRSGMALPWSFSGYGRSRTPGSLGNGQLSLITPQATVLTLAAGFKPVWHDSARTGVAT